MSMDGNGRQVKYIEGQDQKRLPVTVKNGKITISNGV